MAKIKKKPEAVKEEQVQLTFEEVGIDFNPNPVWELKPENPEIIDLYNQILGYVKVNKDTKAQGLVVVNNDLARSLRQYVQENLPENDRIRISIIAVKDFSTFNKHLKFGWVIIDKGIDEDTYNKLKTETRTLVRI